MAESAAEALRRMTMRAWRRGTREMDLILGPFAEARLAGLAPADLAVFDALLDENDHDLYGWITGALPRPAGQAALLGAIAAFAQDRRRPGGA